MNKVYLLKKNDLFNTNSDSEIVGIFLNKEEAELELLKIKNIIDKNKKIAEKFGLHSYSGECSYYSLKEENIGLNKDLLPTELNSLPTKEIFGQIFCIISTLNYSNSVESKKQFSLFFKNKSVKKYPTFSIIPEIEKKKWYISERKHLSSLYNEFKQYNNYFSEKDFLMVYLINDYSGVFIEKWKNDFNVISFTNKEKINGILSNLKLNNKGIKFLFNSKSFEETFDFSNNFISR